MLSKSFFVFVNKKILQYIIIIDCYQIINGKIAFGISL